MSRCGDASVIVNRASRRYSINYSKDGISFVADECRVDRIQRGMAPEEILTCLNVKNGDELVYTTNTMGLTTLTLVGFKSVNCD